MVRSLLIIVSALFFIIGSAGAEEAGGRSGAGEMPIEKDLENARQHLSEALRSLQKAGQGAVEKYSPSIRQESDRAMQEMQKLLGDWEQKFLKKKAPAGQMEPPGPPVRPPFSTQESPNSPQPLKQPPRKPLQFI